MAINSPKSFFCDLCPKYFETLTLLKKHERIRHKEVTNLTFRSCNGQSLGDKHFSLLMRISEYQLSIGQLGGKISKLDELDGGDTELRESVDNKLTIERDESCSKSPSPIFWLTKLDEILVNSEQANTDRAAESELDQRIHYEDNKSTATATRPDNPPTTSAIPTDVIEKLNDLKALMESSVSQPSWKQLKANRADINSSSSSADDNNENLAKFRGDDGKGPLACSNPDGSADKSYFADNTLSVEPSTATTADMGQRDDCNHSIIINIIESIIHHLQTTKQLRGRIVGYPLEAAALNQSTEDNNEAQQSDIGRQQAVWPAGNSSSVVIADRTQSMLDNEGQETGAELPEQHIRFNNNNDKGGVCEPAKDQVARPSSAAMTASLECTTAARGPLINQAFFAGPNPSLSSIAETRPTDLTDEGATGAAAGELPLILTNDGVQDGAEGKQLLEETTPAVVAVEKGNQVNNGADGQTNSGLVAIEKFGKIGSPSSRSRPTNPPGGELSSAAADDDNAPLVGTNGDGQSNDESKLNSRHEIGDVEKEAAGRTDSKSNSPDRVEVECLRNNSNGGAGANGSAASDWAEEQQSCLVEDHREDSYNKLMAAGLNHKQATTSLKMIPLNDDADQAEPEREPMDWRGAATLGDSAEFKMGQQEPTRVRSASCTEAHEATSQPASFPESIEGKDNDNNLNLECSCSPLPASRVALPTRSGRLVEAKQRDKQSPENDVAASVSNEAEEKPDEAAELRSSSRGDGDIGTAQNNNNNGPSHLIDKPNELVGQGQSEILKKGNPTRAGKLNGQQLEASLNSVNSLIAGSAAEEEPNFDSEGDDLAPHRIPLLDGVGAISEKKRSTDQMGESICLAGRRDCGPTEKMGESGGTASKLHDGSTDVDAVVGRTKAQESLEDSGRAKGSGQSGNNEEANKSGRDEVLLPEVARAGSLAEVAASRADQSPSPPPSSSSSYLQFEEEDGGGIVILGKEARGGDNEKTNNDERAASSNPATPMTGNDNESTVQTSIGEHFNLEARVGGHRREFLSIRSC